MIKVWEYTPVHVLIIKTLQSAKYIYIYIYIYIKRMDCSIASLLHTLGRDFEPIIFEGQSHIRPPWLNTYHMYTIYIYIRCIRCIRYIRCAVNWWSLYGITYSRDAYVTPGHTIPLEENTVAIQVAFLKVVFWENWRHHDIRCHQFIAYVNNNKIPTSHQPFDNDEHHLICSPHSCSANSTYTIASIPFVWAKITRIYMPI